jgi:large subunit ribosomal protein L35
MSGKGHKGLRKRLKISAGGKALHRSCGKSHLMSGKSAKRSRRLRKWKALARGDKRALERQFGAVLKP